MKFSKNISSFLLKPSEIHIWFFDLESQDYDLLSWERLLSEEEINHSRHFKFDRDRLRFIARRGILRQLLGQYSGMDPAKINYFTNPYGKLSLPLHPFSFNISNSQNKIVYAFTQEKDIGIDIERVRLLPELSRLMGFLFSPEEREAFSVLPPSTQLDAFYHVWTQKEAFLKAQGKGLTLPLQDFSVSVDPNKPGWLLSINCIPDDISHWKMIIYIPESGWRVAVCVRSEKIQKVHVFMPSFPVSKQNRNLFPLNERDNLLFTTHEHFCCSAISFGICDH